MEAAATPLIPRRKQRVDAEEESSRCTCSIAEEAQWALREAHVMVWQYSCGCFYGDVPEEEQRQFAILKYNPFYWLLVVTAALCVAPGRWAHSLVGQGGPVREDELPVEHEARVQWIYATDGPFVLAILFTIFEAAVGSAGNWLSVAFDLAIDTAYVFGNVLFLDSMRCRNVARIRVGIVANAAFALALTVLLVTGIVKHAHRHWSFFDRATWCARGMAVVFFAFATFIYASLWNAHRDAPPPKDGALVSADVAATLGMVLAAVVVWTLLLIVILVSPAFVWDAVAT